jgi:GNAT superfamily N-acetyltransferase
VELTEIPPDASALFLDDLAVVAAARGAGLARHLVGPLLSRARQKGIRQGSLVAVQDSARFSERMGFRVRPDLTKRFRETVLRSYQADFVFMTADWIPPPARRPYRFSRPRRKRSQKASATAVSSVGRAWSGNNSRVRV